MATSDKREHARTPLRARVWVTHPRFGRLTVSTCDISDGGVFIEGIDELRLELGEIIEIQVQGLPVEAPIRKMIVTRKGFDGYGLRFLDDSDS